MTLQIAAEWPALSWKILNSPLLAAISNFILFTQWHLYNNFRITAMDFIQLVVTILAVISDFVFVGVIYYRAGLKGKLEKINQLQSKQEFIFPSPGKILNYFTEEPKINQSTKNTKLYKKYDSTGTIIKYAFFSLIIFNFTRVLIINFGRI